MTLADELAEQYTQYQEYVAEKLSKAKDTTDTVGIYEKIHDAYFDIMVGQNNNRVLYSGKKVLCKVDDASWYRRYLVISQNAIGSQASKDTSKHINQYAPREFVGILMQYGDKINEVLTNYHNKRQISERFCAILNEHLDVDDGVDSTSKQISVDPTEVEYVVSGKIYEVYGFTCEISSYGDVDVKVLHDTDVSYDSYTYVDGRTKSLVLCEGYYDQITQLIDETVEQHNSKNEEVRNVLEIINSEFQKELVAARM